MLHSTPSFLIAATLLLAAMPGPANAQQAAQEVDSVSRDVVRHASWLADSRKCPTEFIAESERRDDRWTNDCKPGKLAACLARCTANDAGACYWLGYELQQAHGVPPSAELLYQRSCRLGIVSGCTNRAAGMLVESPVDPQVQACAAATFGKACSFDDPWGCTMYAFHLSRGIGVAPDRELALKALEKSCRYGAEDPACSSGMQLRDDIQGAPRAGSPDR